MRTTLVELIFRRGLYDASCDGTWLLMKDCYEAKRWHSSNVNDYANSEINSYLDFPARLDFLPDNLTHLGSVLLP